MASFVVLGSKEMNVHLLKHYIHPEDSILEVPSGASPFSYDRDSAVCVNDKPVTRLSMRGALIGNFEGLSTLGVVQKEASGAPSHEGLLNRSIPLSSLQSKAAALPSSAVTHITSLFPLPDSKNVIFSVRPCLLLPTVLNYFLRLRLAGHSISLVLVPCCTHPAATDLDTEPTSRALPSILFTSKIQADICDEIVSFLENHAPDSHPRWEQVRMEDGREVKGCRVVLAGGADKHDEFWDVHDMPPPPPNFLVPNADEFYDDQKPGGKEDDGVIIVHAKTGDYKYFVNRADGVLGHVGMEPWDAGYVLLGNIVKGRMAGKKKVLELGAGVGFVGLTIGREVPDASVHLTDYDADVLRILKRNTERVGDNVTSGKLDWFDSEGDSEGGIGEYDLIIGAEVIYTPDHRILADVIWRNLVEGGHAKIVNMKRPGFDEFLDRARRLGFRIDVGEEESLEEAYKLKGSAVEGEFVLITLRKEKVCGVT
ncbi:hypothetical protein TrRE_jg9842 [Triparma retinervis]|uniref:Uncharacterized protein n=1 Tax=Triparma retinervis TaxID=2557542 RepID=A0A9W7E455_9STRA|nr:hypothetical protein TrRE_jg9842 [Triparma retinervis]